MWPFGSRKKKPEEELDGFWKEDFSDCITSDYLPTYSVCRSGNNRQCRHVAMYAGMTLCGNPEHKSFIPADSQPFDPHRNQFRD